MRVLFYHSIICAGLMLVSMVAAASTCPAADRALPTLLVLGSPACFNCRLMQPGLERLRDEYRGRVVFSFIDVEADPEQARVFQLRKTPTLVFYDSRQLEVRRHAGFMERIEIVGALEQVLAAGKGHGQ